MYISLIIQTLLIDRESILQILYDTHMKITASYSVAFKDGYDAIKRTTAIYYESVRYTDGLGSACTCCNCADIVSMADGSPDDHKRLEAPSYNRRFRWGSSQS